jgi:adenosylcobinamide kinase/adenosylcobinamide-phosphate guanylyltransferase
VTRTLLVLGGARSGKSRYAQTVAEQSGLSPVLVATATAGDAEMAERIARHRAERDGRWHTIEEPRALAALLAAEAALDRIIVVDCLTLWLANLTFADADIEAETRALSSALSGAQGPVVLVSNEVGSGIVPETALGRRFRDSQGRLNQALAAACDSVVLVVAGLALTLKPVQVPPIVLG